MYHHASCLKTQSYLCEQAQKIVLVIYPRPHSILCLHSMSKTQSLFLSHDMCTEVEERDGQVAMNISTTSPLSPLPCLCCFIRRFFSSIMRFLASSLALAASESFFELLPVLFVTDPVLVFLDGGPLRARV